ESQAGDLREVARVARQERRAVREGDARDFQIHRADAHAFSSKAPEQVGGGNIPRKHVPCAEKINAALEPFISKNLPMRIGESMDFREPSTQLLFDCYDRGRGLLPRRSNACEQLQASVRRK